MASVALHHFQCNISFMYYYRDTSVARKRKLRCLRASWNDATSQLPTPQPLITCELNRITLLFLLAASFVPLAWIG
jgi:hypothetical protein